MRPKNKRLCSKQIVITDISHFVRIYTIKKMFNFVVIISIFIFFFDQTDSKDDEQKMNLNDQNPKLDLLNQTMDGQILVDNSSSSKH